MVLKLIAAVRWMRGYSLGIWCRSIYRPRARHVNPNTASVLCTVTLKHIHWSNRRSTNLTSLLECLDRMDASGSCTPPSLDSLRPDDSFGYIGYTPLLVHQPVFPHHILPRVHLSYQNNAAYFCTSPNNTKLARWTKRNRNAWVSVVSRLRCAWTNSRSRHPRHNWYSML
jgi:hypothetical protein